MSAPRSLLQAAINRLGARLGSGLADTAAGLAVLAQEAPERLKRELDLFWEEVEREAERLESDPAAPVADPADAAGPQDQIDDLRARVAALSRRLEDRS
jgi:uncharacterized protein YceH (UPF0502 family)